MLNVLASHFVILFRSYSVEYRKLDHGVLKLVHGLYRQFGSGGILNWFSGSAGVLASNGACAACRGRDNGSGEREREREREREVLPSHASKVGAWGSP